jgi:hypothetical protein
MITLIIIILITASLCSYNFGYVKKPEHPRLAYYKALLKVIEKQLDTGICGESIYGMGVDIYDDNMLKNAPELWLFKPTITYDRDYWFKKGDKAPRIELLEKVIKYCEK